MPDISSEPGQSPGSFGIFKDVVKVRQQDQSILVLGVIPLPSDTWANVVTRGSNSGQSITVTGSLEMISTQTNSDPKNVLTVNSVPGIPEGVSAPQGSIVYNEPGKTMFVKTTGFDWEAFDVSNQNWNQTLGVGLSTGNIDPIITMDREIIYDTGIKISGDFNKVISASTTSAAIGSITDSSGTDSVCLGPSSKSLGNKSVAIGVLSRAQESGSTALGRSAKSLHQNSTALGNDSETTISNQIRLGTASQYVSVPGYIQSGLTEGGTLISPDGTWSVGATSPQTVVWETVVTNNARTAPNYAVPNSSVLTLHGDAYYYCSVTLLGTFIATTTLDAYIEVGLKLTDGGSSQVIAQEAYWITVATASVTFELTAVFRASSSGATISFQGQQRGAEGTGQFLFLDSGFFSVFRIS